MLHCSEITFLFHDQGYFDVALVMVCLFCYFSKEMGRLLISFRQWKGPALMTLLFTTSTLIHLPAARVQKLLCTSRLLELEVYDAWSLLAIYPFQAFCYVDKPGLSWTYTV